MLTDRSKAKESTFAEIREKLIAFEGDVISAVDGMWGGGRGTDGKPIKPKEFLEVKCNNVRVIETLGALPIDVTEWSFRITCSEQKNSFWVEDFLASADRFKLLIPNDLIGKRILWRKAARNYEFKDGRKAQAVNYIIAGVGTPTPQGSSNVSTTVTVDTLQSAKQVQVDPIEVALELAVGKTETQFRSAIGLHPQYQGSPLLKLAQSGAITTSLVKDGKLVLVKEGDKEVYRKP